MNEKREAELKRLAGRIAKGLWGIRPYSRTGRKVIREHLRRSEIAKAKKGKAKK